MNALILIGMILIARPVEGEIFLAENGSAYYLQEGSKRLFLTPGIYQACTNGFEYAETYPQAVVSVIPEGNPITLASCLPENTLLMEEESGQPYLLRHGQLWPVPENYILVSTSLRPIPAYTFAREDLETIPQAETQPLATK